MHHAVLNYPVRSICMCIGGGMVWQVGGPKGHGAELMINIALASMHVILYIDILGPTIVMSGGAMAPLAPPVPPPMMCVIFCSPC